MLLAAVLALVALSTTTGAAALAEPPARGEDPFTFGNPAFCAPKEPVEDFGLSGLPPIREVPESGDLPFAPKTVDLQLSPGPVLPIGASFGFWLHSENYGGQTPLRWVLRAQLRPVDSSSGQTGRVVARGRVRVRTIRAADEVKLFLAPPRLPGSYRYDLEVVDFDGKRLGSYGEYLRVERKFWNARLGLNRHGFRPGEQVLSRVENLGTETVLYGEEFGIQREEAGAWVRVRNVTQDIWLAWLGFAGPGLAGRCSALRLPPDFPPGHYRIVKEVGRYPWPSKRSRSYYLTAPFEVAG